MPDSPVPASKALSPPSLLPIFSFNLSPGALWPWPFFWVGGGQPSNNVLVCSPPSNFYFYFLAVQFICCLRPQTLASLQILKLQHKLYFKISVTEL